jgi:hypothetical protein
MEATQQLEKDAGFMDKYSRQIGAFGLETMAKVRKASEKNLKQSDDHLDSQYFFFFA